VALGCGSSGERASVELLSELLGWVGGAAILVAYFLNSLGKIGTGRMYQALNFLGAAGVVWNSVYHLAWPSVALNGAWAAIALVALVALSKRRKP
jgi:hypothetical protein